MFSAFEFKDLILNKDPNITFNDVGIAKKLCIPKIFQNNTKIIITHDSMTLDYISIVIYKNNKCCSCTEMEISFSNKNDFIDNIINIILNKLTKLNVVNILYFRTITTTITMGLINASTNFKWNKSGLIGVTEHLIFVV